MIITIIIIIIIIKQNTKVFSYTVSNFKESFFLVRFVWTYKSLNSFLINLSSLHITRPDPKVNGIRASACR